MSSPTDMYTYTITKHMSEKLAYRVYIISPKNCCVCKVSRDGRHGATSSHCTKMEPKYFAAILCWRCHLETRTLRRQGHTDVETRPEAIFKMTTWPITYIPLKSSHMQKNKRNFSIIKPLPRAPSGLAR